MTAPKLTPARRDGLLVIAAGDRRNQEVRVSNRTTSPDHPQLAVERRTARWLVDEGLALDELGPVRDGLRLTPAGRGLLGKIARAKR